MTPGMKIPGPGTYDRLNTVSPIEYNVRFTPVAAAKVLPTSTVKGVVVYPVNEGDPIAYCELG